MPACGTTRGPPPAKVVAKAIKDTPPAELTRCPVDPAGFPADAAGKLPAPVREALVRLATAYGENTAQLRRLIEWVAPGACAQVKPAQAAAPK